MRLRRWIGLGAMSLCLVLAPPAQAAFKRAPIELGAGDGTSPSVVMDPSGTAHVAWGIAEELIGYCAIPRGARACTHQTTLALDARASRPTIMRRPRDGALIVVAGRDEINDDPDGSAWAFSSPDGISWSGPMPIGLGLGTFEAAVLTADGQAVDLLEDDTPGNFFQRAPLAGPPAVETVNLALEPDGTVSAFDYPGDLVRTRNGSTLAFLGSPADGFAYRILGGGDPFADASWQPAPPKRVTARWNEPRGAAGRGGAYVMYGSAILDQVYGGAPQLVRRLGKRGWGRPRGLFFEVSGVTSNAALAQDGSGRLYAAMVANASGKGSCIAFARTGRGRWFTHAVSVFKTVRDAEAPGRPRVAVDARGRGVVVWSSTGRPFGARLQWLKSGKGVTRPRAHSSRGCPPFPR